MGASPRTNRRPFYWAKKPPVIQSHGGAGPVGLPSTNPLELRAGPWQGRGDRPGWSGGTGLLGRGGETQHGRPDVGHGCMVRACGVMGGNRPKSDRPLAQAGISLTNWALHPVCPAPPTRSCSQGLGHTTHTGSRRPTHRSSNARPRGSPTRLSTGAGGHRSLLASGPACPLTMMASACLASSSETARRKPLGCGVVVLGVGMVLARSRAPLHSPLPGGLL